VPKNTDFANSSSTVDDDLPTTMMIRNIPNRYTQKDFIQEFDSLGFKGTYNFLHFPMDKKGSRSCGYAFVNFIDHHWAAQCVAVFHHYMLNKQKKDKGKGVEVCTARLQGLEANIAHFRNTSIIHDGVQRRGRVCGPLIVGSLSDVNI
jgi:RNA recognition motif-containing protein